MARGRRELQVRMFSTVLFLSFFFRMIRAYSWISVSVPGAQPYTHLRIQVLIYMTS